jgi:transcriptional regulator with XRE-family HTH domain
MPMQGANGMEQDATDAADAIAATLRHEREARKWSLAELAERSGVSKAMISKIERKEASPTATVLGRLSGAFGVPLSVLIASAEKASERLSMAEAQPVWTDPETGYLRKAVSPAGAPVELIEVSLPAGVRVPYPASAFAFQQQQIWVLEGRLDFSEADTVHGLKQGDCLLLGVPSDCAFFNPGGEAARYLVVLSRR